MPSDALLRCMAPLTNEDCTYVKFTLPNGKRLLALVYHCQTENTSFTRLPYRLLASLNADSYAVSNQLKQGSQTQSSM